MRGRRARVIVAAVAVAVVLSLCAFLPVSYPPPGDAVLDDPDHLIVGPIWAGNTLAAQFLASGDRLVAFTPYLATYGRVNAGSIRVVVLTEYDRGWRRVGEQRVDTAMLEDNAYRTIAFTPPVPVERGKPVRVRIESDNSAENAVTWWSVPEKPDANHLFLVNEQIVRGGAVFTAQYAPGTRPLVFALGGVWERATTYLAAPWRALLAAALVVSGAGMLALFARFPAHDTPAREVGRREGT